MNKRRHFSSKLTVAISKGDCSLIDVLSNEDLSITVRNEAEAFIKYFFPPDEMAKPEPTLPNFDELIKLALEPDESQKEKYPLFQLSRNAANVLSSISDRLQKCYQEDKSKRFFKALRKFIFNKKFNQNPMFAGHFQRIIEVTLRSSANDLLDLNQTIKYNDNFTKEVFIKFIIENSEILPYRELLSTVISEFYEYFPTVVDETLRYAAAATISIEEDDKTIQNSLQLKEDIYTQSEESLQKLQPVNCFRDRIPVPYYLLKKAKKQSNTNPRNDKSFLSSQKEILKFDDFKDFELISKNNSDASNNYRLIHFALNLLYGLKNALEYEVFEVISQKIKEDKAANKDNDTIRYLLICGMFADSESSLSYTSFSLLFNLLNERHRDQDDMYDDKYILNLHPPKIIDEYAEHFVFDPYEVTEAMISGLLVFWNHRYPDPLKNGEKTKGEQVLPDYTTQVGISALELLLPTILTEPMYSNKLCINFAKIISSLEQEIIDSIEKDYTNQQSNRSTSTDNSDDPDNSNRCFLIDSIWYELLTYKFKLSPDDKELITIQDALQKLLSLPTTDAFYQEGGPENESTRSRAPTNPIIFMLSEIINHGAFFSFKKGIRFQKLLTINYEPEWIENAMIYSHIIDRMEKQLVNMKYDSKKPIIADEETKTYEIIYPADYEGKLTNSFRFKI